MGTVSAHLCLWPWSTVPLRAHSCDFHGAVLGYLRWFPSCMTWNQVPRVRSISYLRFSVWSLANGWSRSSEAQQRCPVSGETQHTTYTAEPPDRIRPRSGFYLKSHLSLSHPSYPLHSFPSSWPFIIHLFCTHSLITGFGFQGMWPKPGPLRWLPGAARQSLIRPGVCSCCWLGILGGRTEAQRASTATAGSASGCPWVCLLSYSFEDVVLIDSCQLHPRKS